jgi:hypothetical protein
MIDSGIAKPISFSTVNVPHAFSSLEHFFVFRFVRIRAWHLRSVPWSLFSGLVKLIYSFVMVPLLSTHSHIGFALTLARYSQVTSSEEDNVTHYGCDHQESTVLFETML